MFGELACYANICINIIIESFERKKKEEEKMKESAPWTMFNRVCFVFVPQIYYSKIFTRQFRNSLFSQKKKTIDMEF